MPRMKKYDFDTRDRVLRAILAISSTVKNTQNLQLDFFFCGNNEQTENWSKCRAVSHCHYHIFSTRCSIMQNIQSVTPKNISYLRVLCSPFLPFLD